MPESDWKRAAEDAGWLPPEKIATLVQELEAALTCLPTEAGLTTFLENAMPASNATDLDNIEAGLDLQECLTSVREAVVTARSLLPGATIPPKVRDPATITVHLLSGGFALCGFSREVPGKWPHDHQWMHDVRDLRRVREKARACSDCLLKAHPPGDSA